MPSTTTCRGYPYPLNSDPPNVAADFALLALAVDADICGIEDVIDALVVGRIYEPGDVKATIRPTPGTGWLMLDGSTIVNGQTIHPALWAVAPASWKSGSSLVLPNASGRTLMAGGVLGSVGGSDTFTLTLANLPSHTHTINHDHPSATSDGENVSHVHWIGHDHPNAVTDAQGTHQHSIPTRLDPISGSQGSIGISNAGGTIVNDRLTNAAGLHQHNIDLPAFGGNSGGISTTHTHNVDIPNYLGVSGAAGSVTPTPVSVTPAHLRVHFMVKT